MITNDTQIGSLNIEIESMNITTQPWSDHNCCHYTIKLTNITTKGSITADFYGSSADYYNKKSELSETELLEATQRIIDDALTSYNYTLPEFLKEFGYLESGESALKGIETYNKCTELFKKFNTMYTVSELEEIINLLYDKLND